MTPEQFQRRWTDHGYTELQAYQDHFRDLCALAEFEPPHDPEQFAFQKPVKKPGGAVGYADVWLRGRFALEYKGTGADLVGAYRQLLDYRDHLENPPLLVVCDLNRLIIHSNFTGTIHRTWELTTATIGEPRHLRLLRDLFFEPERFNPNKTAEQLTEEAAAEFGKLADSLRGRTVARDDESDEAAALRVAHFLVRLVFCLFAEDIRLLPVRDGVGLFTRLARTFDDNATFDRHLRELFAAMADGGDAGWETIRRFNGGLFEDADTLPLTDADRRLLIRACNTDWGQIEPAIFGTLFERILDPDRRSQRGAHYTSKADILRVVEPVILAPLRRDWAAVQAACEPLLDKYRELGDGVARRNRAASLTRLVADFHDQLCALRILDPACGSGNFLYVALERMLELEDEVFAYAAAWGMSRRTERVHPDQFHGLDIEPFAAELAQVTLWIGYLQHYAAAGRAVPDDPILSKQQGIECRDAIFAMSVDGDLLEPPWPEADRIIGNPPFLGGKKLRAGLGDQYIERLFRLYDGRVPREADLCCYWFERARAEVVRRPGTRVGLLATNSLRQGPQMRPVLRHIAESGGIFEAWSDEPWILDGAAVRIAIVCFDDGTQTDRVLDGRPVGAIHPDLTSGLDLTVARRLPENDGIAFMGDTKGGPFDIPGELARTMLAAPNPLGRDNADVVRPWWNGLDVARRPRDVWIVDFGTMTEADAALYEAPFEYVREHVRPDRLRNNRASYREKWWLHVEPRPAMRAALAGLPRYLVTAIVAKHRLFVWCPPEVLPDHRLIAFARDDDYLLGILHSRPHEIWSLRTGSTLEDRPSYTPSTCFDTFPFPRPTDAQRAAIAAAAAALHAARQSRLDGDLTLTLTALYNQRPTWLANLHRDLDAAVLAAYGLPADIDDEALLAHLLALNLNRAPA